VHRPLGHGDGGDHADHPVRRVHALRHEQAAGLARAGGRGDDGDVLFHRRRRGLSRQRAFMLLYGVHLCQVTWQNTMAEFPALRVGIVYLPIPVAGLFTLLFILEKVWLGDPPKTDVMYTDQAAELE
jgi:hypothetical protein